MKVGLDFDNTIVCYDRLFHTLAVERGLIPPETPVNKTAVRDYLRRIDREDDWTVLQGVAYGPEIHRAEPYPGVLDFLHRCRAQGVPVCIISHKTRHPYRGLQYDLHAAARSFLARHGFLQTAETGLGDENVFLELTKEAKLARIGAAGCTHFVDDLPEFLAEVAFPAGTARVLFDPDDRTADEPGRRRFRSWRELDPSAMTSGGEPDPVVVERLLDAAGFATHEFRLESIAGGGNNRGYRLTLADGRAYFLKWYFRHPDDPRDRLGTEYAFCEFCRRHGIADVPLPAARDDAAGLALYEFVAGRRMKPEEIDAAAVDAAVDFYRRLNARRREPDAAALPVASEACFSVAEHFALIARRVQALRSASADPAADDDFRRFVELELAPAWNDVSSHIDCDEQPLPRDERFLSPSDFGFHNALRQPDGRLRFLDLEYAGWDDPAKTIGDFFCQVQVPVPMSFWPRVLDGLAADQPSPAGFRRRAARLLPIYRLKWCCIVLNVFLPTGSSRRAFGTTVAMTADRRAEQLFKARRNLARLPNDLEISRSWNSAS